MSESTEAERMARLEARFDSMENLIIRMDTKLDAWNESFMPRKESEARFENVAKDIEKIEQKSRNTWNNIPFWVSAACSMFAIGLAIWSKKG